MTTDETRKVAELLEDERIGMVTTTPPEGTLGWRPPPPSTGTPTVAGWPA
jgi:hypothetical protein